MTVRRARRLTTHNVGLLFVLPAVVHLFVFAVLPIAYAFWVSLFDWKILRGTMPFVGLSKYSEVVRDASFWNALWNSARFAALSVPAGMVVALLVATLVSKELRGSGVFRTLFYIPAVSSVVAVSMLWIYVFLPTTGLINMTTAVFGAKSIDFLNDPWWAMGSLAFMSVWTGLGPRMIIYVAGLMSIPPSLFEAADLDGANSVAKFCHVTWPLLAPTNLFVLVTGTIAAFQLFTPVYMMTKGGPLDSTDVVGYHIYQEAWHKFHVSTAAAQSFLLLIVIAVLAWIQFRMMRGQLEGFSSQ